MIYLLVHVLQHPAKDWVERMKEELRKSFPVSDLGGIDPHFTLKYCFDQEQLATMEHICSKVAERHVQAPFTLEGFGSFDRRVVFLKVTASPAMQELYADLFSSMQEEGIPFEENERQGIHFHVTLAELQKLDEFDRIMAYLQEHRICFPLKLDNLTILKFEDDEFKLHKEYRLRV